MKKIQLPAIGGIRKVIQPGASVAAGTTIAELGANTITLAQLAQIITQIQQQQNNTGGGNIVGPATPGGGNNATLVLGPGLTGGGVLVGNVPIRLTAPIPWGLDDGGGGGDGDPGPPGAAGAAGSNGVTGGQGPVGPAVFLEAEPGEDGLWAIPGPQGIQGVMGSQGPIGPSGTGSGGGGTGVTGMWIPEENYPDDPTYNPSSFAYPTIIGTGTIKGNLVFDGTANRNITFTGVNPVLQAVGTSPLLQIQTPASGSIQIGTQNAQNILLNTNGQTSFSSTLTGGSQVLVAPGAVSVTAIVTQAGSTNANSNMIWKNASNVQLMDLFGDGSLTVGPSTLAAMGTGTVNVSNAYFVNNVPLSRSIGVGIYPIPEDTWTDEEIFRGPPTSVGPLAVNGPFQIASPTPAVSLGITALGTTTTGTVITTAGGIALPALASTFWVTNVNGVAYGIPLFAL